MHGIRVELRDGVVIVKAEGEVDAFVAPDLESAFGEAAGSTAGAVVVDLERVSFLDSTALGAIVRAVRELGEVGTAARVVLPRGSARRIFEITTLDRVLPSAASTSAALEDLDASAGPSAR